MSAICARSSVTTRLAIVSTHPIQYNAPAFRSLASNPDLEVHVFYEWEGPGTLDPEFGQAVKWDVPLLDGYDHTFVPNAARTKQALGRTGGTRGWDLEVGDP